MSTPLQPPAGAAPAQGVADKMVGRICEALQLVRFAAATLVCGTLQMLHGQLTFTTACRWFFLVDFRGMILQAKLLPVSCIRRLFIC